jgi:hypothetical protein
MSEIIVPIITAIISGLFGWYLRGKDEKDKNRRDTIREYYPPLLNDIRDNMRLNINNFYSTYGNFPVSFTKLSNIIDDGTIKIIDACDKELYENLIRIENEIIPLLFEFDVKRNNLVKIIEEKWIDYLNSLAHTEGFQIKTKEFVHQLIGFIIWDIWRENYEYVRQKYVNFLIQEIIFIPPT